MNGDNYLHWDEQIWAFINAPTFSVSCRLKNLARWLPFVIEMKDCFYYKEKQRIFDFAMRLGTFEEKMQTFQTLRAAGFPMTSKMLDYAAKRGNVGLVKFLLDNGCPIRDAYQLAYQYCKRNVMKLLEERNYGHALKYCQARASTVEELLEVRSNDTYTHNIDIAYAARRLNFPIFQHYADRLRIEFEGMEQLEAIIEVNKFAFKDISKKRFDKECQKIVNLFSDRVRDALGEPLVLFAASKGLVSLLNIFENFATAEVFIQGIRHQRFETLHWAVEKKIPMQIDVMIDKAYKIGLKMVKFVHSLGSPNIGKLGKCNDLNIIDWYLHNKKIMPSEMYRLACENVNPRVVLYMRQNFVELVEHVEHYDYDRNYPLMLSEMAELFGAKCINKQESWMGAAGSIENIQWLIDQGAKWDPQIMTYAASHGAIDVIMWIIKSGLPYEPVNSTFPYHGLVLHTLRHHALQPSIVEAPICYAQE